MWTPRLGPCFSNPSFLVDLPFPQSSNGCRPKSELLLELWLDTAQPWGRSSFLDWHMPSRTGAGYSLLLQCLFLLSSYTPGMYHCSRMTTFLCPPGLCYAQLLLYVADSILILGQLLFAILGHGRLAGHMVAMCHRPFSAHPAS